MPAAPGRPLEIQAAFWGKGQGAGDDRDGKSCDRAAATLEPTPTERGDLTKFRTNVPLRSETFVTATRVYNKAKESWFGNLLCKGPISLGGGAHRWTWTLEHFVTLSRGKEWLWRDHHLTGGSVRGEPWLDLQPYISDNGKAG